jgi:RNA polymerase sigma-70 factor (ECF subfamily)
MTEHDAQDAVQGFFESLLRRETFAKADENLGKLRQLLLRAFEHFCAQQWNRANRMKRGGHVEHMDLGWLMDTGKAEQQFLKSGSAELSIEALYNREWANALLERSLASMQADYQKKGWSERYDLLVRFLLGNDDAGSLEQLASGRGVTSNSLRVTLHRMRAHYRQHVERELASTLDTDNPQVIREELVELFNAYSDHV